jgi:transposase
MAYNPDYRLCAEYAAHFGCSAQAVAKRLKQHHPKKTFLYQERDEVKRQAYLSEYRELIEKVLCRLVFLPPYSPDLNPIENCCAIIKVRLKKIGQPFDNFDHALNQVLSIYLSSLNTISDF